MGSQGRVCQYMSPWLCWELQHHPSPSKMMVRSTLHQQPQQAKVEEEDVDACDIIYLLLGVLVQMIWGEVPSGKLGGFRNKKLTWEGFVRSIHPSMSARMTMFFRSLNEVPKVQVEREKTSNGMFWFVQE